MISLGAAPTGAYPQWSQCFLDHVEAIAAARWHAGLGISHRLVRPPLQVGAKHGTPQGFIAELDLGEAAYHFIDAIGRVIRQIGHDLAGRAEWLPLEDEIMWQVL